MRPRCRESGADREGMSLFEGLRRRRVLATCVRIASVARAVQQGVYPLRRITPKVARLEVLR